MLLREVWGAAYEDDTQVLRVHIANLRRKIEPEPGSPRYITTDPGVGYRFTGLTRSVRARRRGAPCGLYARRS